MDLNKLKEEQEMALYKHLKTIEQSDDAGFDETFDAGTFAPFSGIFCCTACGREVASTQEQLLPSRTHHQHTQHAPIHWRLVVWADHNPKSDSRSTEFGTSETSL
jgi:hypothetical protein